MSTYENEGLPPIPDWLHENLLKWSGNIIVFLNNLTSDVTLPKGVIQKAAMPQSAFKGVKALAFVFRRKWACLASYQQDIGFVTRKITGPDGISWSAPYFMVGRSFGIGFTIGSLKSGICLALMNDEAVKSYIKKKHIMTVSGQFLIDMDGARIRPTRLDSTANADNVIRENSGAMMAKYFRMMAMMIDFSVGGGMVGPWTSRNKYMYGKATFDDVWEGKTQMPSEFIPVMDVLKRYAQEAAHKPKLPSSRSRSGREGNQLVLKHTLSSSSGVASEISA